MSKINLGLPREDYFNPGYLRHMVLDFIQMHEFMENPLVFEHGEGIWVWDVQGEKYLDGISGVWVTNLGYSNAHVKQAIKNQLDQLIFCSPIYSTNARAVEYVEMLGQVTPPGLTTIKLLSGGSEATETAIKLVRQYFQNIGQPNRKTIISRYYNFHGVTLGALAATGMSNRKTPFEPVPGGFRHIAPPYCLRCPYHLKYPDCNVVCARFLEQVIQYEGPETVAAFMAEPIQLSTGNIVPPPEYWPIIREICNRYGVLIILDEVATGVGRTGKMWGSETFGFVPDVLCAGKGLSAGHAPFSAVAFRDEVADVFISPDHEKAFMDGHTYGGNPLAAAAGIAVLEEMEEHHLVQRVEEMGRYLMDKLDDLKELGVVGDIRGKGLMIGIELVHNPTTLEKFPKQIEFGLRVGRNCMHKKHMIVRMSPDWVAIAPPYIIEPEEIDEMVRRLGQAVEEELSLLKQ